MSVNVNKFSHADCKGDVSNEVDRRFVSEKKEVGDPYQFGKVSRVIVPFISIVRLQKSNGFAIIFLIDTPQKEAIQEKGKKTNPDRIATRKQQKLL